jgi:hypothetical protein
MKKAMDIEALMLTATYKFEVFRISEDQAKTSLFISIYSAFLFIRYAH